MVWVKLVFNEGMNTGGVTVIVYVRFTPLGGGVHVKVTVELKVPFTMLVSLTSLGGPRTFE